MAGHIAVRVEDVSKRFRIYHQRNQTLKQTLLTGRRSRYEELWALKDVNLEVERGTTFGIIGENGSGKSTLLKTMAGILKPDRGQVVVEGRLAALLELGAGFHPEYSGRENIYLNGALLGLTRRMVDSVFDQIVEFSELERFIDNAVKTYSSGMYARLGFAISVFVDPDVLIVDEILAVGDESFQRRCYQRIDDMKAAGKTLILVSHALDTIVEHCRDCAWLEEGQVRALGPAREVVPQYLDAVREREEKSMATSVARLHQEVPSGRLGVGVTEVRFIGPDGAGHQFRSGKDFEVQVEYHSPSKMLRGARFSVEFVRGDGVLAFSTSSNGDAQTELPGSGVVRLKVPSLPLMDGLYRLGVTISDAATDEPYTVLANAFPFRVLKEDFETAGAERGVAHLEHSWLMPVQS
jgi:ABC-type polysaccharide/polyol phosphate transport system ATPase subunit